MAERRGVLLAVLVFAMTASSYQIFAISVLAVDIIDDLGMSRTALGFLGSLNTLVGALTAPTMGRVTDRIGARQAILALLAISGLGMALMALAGNWWLLAISAAVAGIPQGWGNPATNALIAERVSAATQGSVTGIKQSGVQLGIFLSGLTLPGLALVIGWRGALWGYAAAFGVGALVVARMLGQPDAEVVRARTAEQGPGGDGSIPSFIWLISVYAFLFGSAGGAIGRFFPLWANEEVGLSTVVAGILVALGGLLGIAARIAAGRVAQSRIAPPKLLSILASIGALYCVMLVITPLVGSWILWPSTVLYSVGIGAWNAVAMLAVIVSVRRESAGKASGLVMLGFLGGLSVGSPIAGAIVDRWDTYQPVWLGAMALSVASALLINPWWRRSRSHQPATARSPST
ncbi:MAG: MFS transporter [Acidimicrobiales bacterium]